MILTEDYGQLEGVVAETIKQTIETKNFDSITFVQNMEKEFARYGFREASTCEVQNILIFRLDAVGDYVLTSAAIRTIRENFPAARITLVVSENLYPLAELCPYVNEVLAVAQSDVECDKNFSPRMIYNVANFAKQYLWRRRFDISFYLGIVFRPIRNFLSYLSGARDRISFDVDKISKYFNNKCIPLLPEYYEHDCLMNLHLLQQAGLKVGDTKLEVWFDKTDLIAAKILLEGFAVGRIKISVGIGANHPSRKYTVEKYLVAFKEIISKGAAIIILGGPDEVEDAKFLENNLPKEFVKNLVEVRAGWRIDVAVMSLTDIYIGNMTGTCDIAAALKKPVVALSRVAGDINNFLNEAISYRPWQTDFIILQPEHQLDGCKEEFNFNGCRSDKSHCIAQITPEEIVEAYEKILR